jgi:hypothetical protein
VVPKSFSGMSLSAGEPVVADVTGNSAPEILLPTNTEVCVVSNTGVQLTDDGPPHNGAFSMYTQTGLAGVAVGDLDNDGIPEVVAVSGTPFPSAADTIVHVWNPLSRVADPPPWGMFRGGPRRLGVAPGTVAGEGSRYVDLDDYVHQLFLDFYGREPGAGEMDPWIGAIESQAMSRAEVGLEFLESEEYRRARETVVRYHLAFLGKPPVSKFLRRWTRQLLLAGCTGMVCSETKRQEIADLLAAKRAFRVVRFPESLTTAQFVQKAYQLILERSPSSQEIAVWMQSMDQGGMTRAEAARLMADSDEYVNDRSRWPVLVILAYMGFLQGKPPTAELNAWVADLKIGLPPVDLVQELMTSDEYLARFVP